MTLGYFGFLAGVAAFFGGVTFWLRRQAHGLDRKYGTPHPPAGE